MILYAGGLYESHGISGFGAGIFGKSYIRAGGRVVAVFTKPAGAPGTFQYLHYDHLDSVDVVTTATGQVVERLSYDAFGKRRNADWLNDTSDLQLKLPHATDRGYTSQEQLDGVGLIHYGGRVYDPILGRFTSADPFIQAPTDVQSYNRYAYVRNNPLSLTDPSGFFSVRKWLKKQAKDIAGAVTFGQNWGIWRMQDRQTKQSQTWRGIYTVVGGYMNPVAAAAYSGYATKRAGGSWTMAFRSAFITGWTAGAMNAVGTLAPVKTMAAENIIGHGLVGGVASVAQGGQFGSGFASGFVSAAVPLPNDPIAATAVSAIVGGTTSVIAGGKFGNGAVTGAFGYLFNRAMHEARYHWSHEKPFHIYTNDEGYEVYNTNEWREGDIVERPIEDWQEVFEIPLRAKINLRIGELELDASIQYVQRKMGQFQVSEEFRVQRYRNTGEPTGLSANTHVQKLDWLNNVSSVQGGIRPCFDQCSHGPLMEWH